MFVELRFFPHFCSYKYFKRDYAMETMTIKYNPSNAFAGALVELIKKTKSIKILSDSRDEYKPNDDTLRAIDDIRKGKVYHAANTEDLFKQILG